MKKLIVLCTILFSAFTTIQAQFGIKGGLNFNTNGDLTQVIQVGQDLNNVISNSNSKIGYHIGIFYQSKGDSFYLRPELIYTKTKSDYSGNDFDMSKLDMPVLIGYKIIKPLSIFTGPAFQYILNTDLELFDLNDVKNDFTVGINIGAALELGSFGVDIRYEKGLSENLANIGGVSDERLDTRPNQFIVSMSLKL